MDNIRTGNLIKNARKEKSMTQKDLALLLNVTDRAVSKWERGLCAPDIGLLEPLSQALDLSVMELISGEKNTESQNIDSAVKSIIDYSENEITQKSRIIKRKSYFSLLAFCMSVIIALITLNSVVFGEGFGWQCIPAHIRAEKRAVAIRTNDRKAIEKYIGSSRSMSAGLSRLEERDVVILKADTKLRRTRLEDLFLVVEIDLIVRHRDIKYRFTANGTYKNRKIELMSIVAEDIDKNYPRWMLQLSDTLSTYNPG